MRKKNFLLLSYLAPIITILIFITSEDSLSSDRPFNNTSNWGGTGLMEIPNARILEDGVVRLEATQALPYRWYSGGIGILPGLEFSGRLTAITNYPALTPEYGSNKDKAFDLKYQILPESKELPAVAIGINDFWGTRLFPSEYIVMSRQIYPFDFTFGIGSKRFSGGSVNFFTDSYSLFGGFELELSDRLMFMAEYNPIKYENDRPSARGAPEGAKYPVNIGLRAKIIKGVELGVSFQRGDTLGLSLSVTSLLGEQILPQKPDPPPLLPVDRRPFSERDRKAVIQNIYDTVKEAGFANIAVYTNGKNIICEFENNKYFSNQKAVGRILRFLLYHSPEDADLLIAVVKRGDLPLLKVSVKPDHLDKYLLGKISEDMFMERLVNVEVTDESTGDDTAYLKVAEDMGYNFNYRLKPELDIFWNDPSGFLKFSTGFTTSFSIDLWKGASANARYSIPLYSNISSPQSEPLPPTVIRSDISKYLKKNYTFERLEVNQIFRFSERLFSQFSLGYFERMYAGVGGEVLYFVGDGKIALGLEGDLLRKRVPKENFELFSFNRHSVLGSAYYYYPGQEMTLKAQYGRFLAGDLGWKIDINRKYKTGVTLGMFVTFTDTDNINQPSYNDDYNHKGVYLSIPMRMFYDTDRANTLNYGISPWTRDVGQTVGHSQPIYYITSDLMPVKFKAEKNGMRY
ncbi:YjbH domain-containing protein [Thermodesulfobacteriota bacterium]